MTFSRRDLIIGGLAVATAATAEALRPRKRLILLKGGKLVDAIPSTFGNWTAEGSNGLVSPEQAGRLARTLYSEIVQRVYTDNNTGAQVMLLAAYGDTQSDLLQLHRPESCYPAVGYNIASTKAAPIPIGPNIFAPGRKVVAVAEDRSENIAYWTRIGEHLPQSGGQQRQDRLADALRGYVSDGILFRSSIVGPTKASFALLDRFLPALMTAVKPDKRPALIGTRLARLLA